MGGGNTDDDNHRQYRRVDCWSIDTSLSHTVAVLCLRAKDTTREAIAVASESTSQHRLASVASPNPSVLPSALRACFTKLYCLAPASLRHAELGLTRSAEHHRRGFLASKASPGRSLLLFHHPTPSIQASASPFTLSTPPHTQQLRTPAFALETPLASPIYTPMLSYPLTSTHSASSSTSSSSSESSVHGLEPLPLELSILAARRLYARESGISSRTRSNRGQWKLTVHIVTESLHDYTSSQWQHDRIEIEQRAAKGHGTTSSRSWSPHRQAKQ